MDFSTLYLLITREVEFNTLTAGAVHVRVLHFLLAHYISAFKHVKDKKITLISKIKKIVDLHFVKSE